MEIRAMTKDDIEDYSFIYTTAYNWRYLNLLEDYPKFNDYFDYFISEGYSFILLNNEGKKCGFITAYILPDMEFGRKMYIEELAVLPEEQKKGYGKALIGTVENIAREKNISVMSLRTFCYMDSYLIYRHLGFKDQRSDARYLTRRVKSDTQKEGE